MLSVTPLFKRIEIGQPLGSDVKPPYWRIAVKDERGTPRELIAGYGLNNPNSSGGPVEN